MIWPVHHVDLVVSSLERSVLFYRELLEWTDEGEIVGERGERVVYLSPPDRPPNSYGWLGLRAAQSGGHAVPYDRYAVGVHHLAFFAASPEEVDAAAERARRLAAEIESGPEEYGYMPGYYAVFLHDPDGIKVEVVHNDPEP